MQPTTSKLVAFAFALHDVAGHVIARSATTSSASSTATSVTDTGKRGLPYNDPLLTNYFSLSGQDSLVSWAYNWYYEEPNLSELNSALEYIPLLYNGNPSVTKPWPTAAQAAIDNGATYLFSYNEPDIEYSGSNYMNISLAVDTWMEYMEPFAGKAKLVAPAVTNSGAPYGLTWLSWFIGNCTECTIDAINIHWYSNQYAGAAYLESHTEDARVVADGRPIIISEFGLDDSSGGYTDTELLEFLEAALPWLDAQNDVVRYAYFYDAAGYLIDSAGTGLSDSGVLYNNYTGTNVTALCPSLNGTTYTDPTSGSNFLVECNIDHAGGNLDVTMPIAYTLAECIFSCANTTGCVDVSLYDGTCYMKGSVGKSSTNTAVQGAKLVAATSSTSSQTSMTSSSTSSTSSTSSSTSSNSSHSLSTSSSSTSASSISASIAASSTSVSATSSPSNSSSSFTSTSVTGSVSSGTSHTVSSSSTSSISVRSSSSISSSVSSSTHASTTTSSAAASKTSMALCPDLNSTIYTDPATGSNYLIECGIDHYAGNLNMVYVSNFVQCISTCANTTGCVDVSLSGTACYMKSSVGAASKNSGVLGAKLVVSTTSTQGSSTSSTHASSTSAVGSSSSTRTSSSSTTVSSSSTKTPSSSTTASSSSAHTTSTLATISSSSTHTSSTSTVISASSSASPSLGANYASSSSPITKSTPLSSTTHTPTSSSSTTSAAKATTTAICPHLNSTIYTEPTTGYNFTIECGIDHNAGNLKMVYVTGLAACIQTCANTIGCVDVSLSGTACYMKSSIGKAVANNGVNGAKLVISASASASASATATASTSATVTVSTSASASSSSSTVSSASSSTSASASATAKAT